MNDSYKHSESPVMDESLIQRFYNGSSVLLTGGTGFMGKILVEKILRTTDISNLYMLVREKRGKNVNQILDDLFENEIFSKLKKARPSFRDKVHPIPGDCSLPDLGLDIIEKQKLIANTNVIFHLAAAIRFDTNLKEAYAINVIGTKDIINMAKHMKSLKAMVYVSTAYSNCPKENIDEKIYDFPYSPEGLYSVISDLNDSDIEKLTPQLLGSWPNTYTFTKALAESIIQNTANDLPIAVFRPSIVMPTYKEPYAGWTDNLNGPVGICMGVVTGTLVVMPYGVRDNIADIVPVDLCIEGLIAVAWDISTKFLRYQENVAVYNFVNGNTDRIRWKCLIGKTIVQAKQQLRKDLQKNIMVIYPPNALIFWILMIVFHLIPAFMNDVYSAVRKKRFRICQMYMRIIKIYKMLYPFFTRTWTFTNRNVQELWKKMEPQDQELFPLSLETVNWEIYFESYVEGLYRIFLSKNITSKKPLPIRKQSWSYFVCQVLKSMLIFFLCTIILSIKIT